MLVPVEMQILEERNNLVMCFIPEHDHHPAEYAFVDVGFLEHGDDDATQFTLDLHSACLIRAFQHVAHEFKQFGPQPLVVHLEQFNNLENKPTLMGEIKRVKCHQTVNTFIHNSPIHDVIDFAVIIITENLNVGQVTCPFIVVVIYLGYILFPSL